MSLMIPLLLAMMCTVRVGFAFVLCLRGMVLFCMLDPTSYSMVGLTEIGTSHSILGEDARCH